MEEHNGFTVTVAVAILAAVSLLGVAVWYFYPRELPVELTEAVVTGPYTDVEKRADLEQLRVTMATSNIEGEPSANADKSGQIKALKAEMAASSANVSLTEDEKRAEVERMRQLME